MSAHERDNARDLVRHHMKGAARYLDEEGVTEIMANPDGKVWIESHARGLYDSGVELSSADRAVVINTVASASGDVVTPDVPHVGGLLPGYGARFQGLIPPAVSGPAFAIRMPSARLIPLAEYVASGTMTREQARTLAWAVRKRKNVLVVGGTGSGKTTLANAVLALLSGSDHRVMIIEDTPELRCEAPNTLAVKVDRQSGFGYQDALFNALRLRPDRIIVGELRDGLAALELLKAWNTGHSGGLATVHANSARSSLPRVEQLLQEVTEFTPRALIAEAIDVVVYVERYARPGPGGRSERARRVRTVALVKDGLTAGGDYDMYKSFDHDSVRGGEAK